MERTVTIEQLARLLDELERKEREAHNSALGRVLIPVRNLTSEVVRVPLGLVKLPTERGTVEGEGWLYTGPYSIGIVVQPSEGYIYTLTLSGITLAELIRLTELEELNPGLLERAVEGLRSRVVEERRRLEDLTRLSLLLNLATR